MKNKIVTLLCILTILITTCIAAANSDGSQTISDTEPEITNLINGNAVDDIDGEDVGVLHEDIKLVPTVKTDGTGAMAKVFQVRNDGYEAVYVRTIFAFEAGALGWEDIHTGFNYSDGWTYSGCSEIIIGGHKYYMVVAIYETVLKSGEVTKNNLKSIGFYNNAEVTNDKISSLGSDFEIRIVSQATFDSDIFDANPITADNHPWVNNN